ncbi:MAG: MauE/DoxX family redox-associated membrane protein [Syntrophobacteraceae bacterium]
MDIDKSHRAPSSSRPNAAAPSGPRSPIRRALSHPFFWGRIFLGAVFVFASIDKIIHPADFAQIIKNYQILPVTLITLAAVVLPWLEMILGVAIIAGVWLPGALALANALLASFFAALLFNVARGLDIHCGCFSSTPTSGKPHMLWYVLRDSSFLLVGMYLLFQTMLRNRPR